MTPKNVTGHWRLMAPSDKYIEWPELGDKDHTLTIRSVVWEEMHDFKTRTTKEMAVMYFEEAKKGFVLGAKCNRQSIAKATGETDSEDWIGKKITIYADPTVKFGRETVGGIRVRESQQ